jgi:predicted MFS family arabinose efflux permease
MSSPTAPANSTRLRVELPALTAARTALNTAIRMVYPFLPRIARGLGVDLEAIALIVTARSGLGLFGPVFGSLADRRGRKNAILIALALFTAAMSLVFVWPSYPALFVGLLLGGVSKLIFDSAMQAYIGDRVDYRRRGLAIAVTELAWSGAFLIGVPVIGWLIARTGQWYAPFPLLAAWGLLAGVLLWRVLPGDANDAGQRSPLPFMRGVRLILSHRSALAGLAIGLLISLGNEVVMIVFGAWMENSFGLEVAALGAASAVIGVAELVSEGAVGGFVDRVGKRRAVAIGIITNAAACVLLPVLGFGVEGALVGLFVFFLTFEFALVSAIPLMTELVPDARATLMAGNLAAHSAGRMIGALAGPPLFTLGLLANGIAAAGINLLALVVLVLFLREGGGDQAADSVA